MIPSEANMFLRAANFDMEKNNVPKECNDQVASHKIIMNE